MDTATATAEQFRAGLTDHMIAAEHKGRTTIVTRYGKPFAALVPTGDLWAIHVEGSDDIVACADYAAAVEEAEALNLKLKDSDPAVIAKVIEWPFSGESHRRELELEGS